MRRAVAAVAALVLVTGLALTSPLAPADGQPTRAPSGVVQPYDESGLPDPPAARFIRLQFLGAGPST